MFPAAADLWAWAHVHVNRGLDAAGEVVSDDMASVLPKFDAAMQENPDLGLSRLVCPRHLAKTTGYHAFVVPTFESGRLAGLGRDPSVAPSATHVAWEDYPARAGEEPGSYPVYYRWYFRTGAVGDFEYLVRLLKPRKVSPKVGQRDMDTQAAVREPAGHRHAGPRTACCASAARSRCPTPTSTPPSWPRRRRYENWDTPVPAPVPDRARRLHRARRRLPQRVARAIRIR